MLDRACAVQHLWLSTYHLSRSTALISPTVGYLQMTGVQSCHGVGEWPSTRFFATLLSQVALQVTRSQPQTGPLMTGLSPVTTAGSEKRSKSLLMHNSLAGNVSGIYISKRAGGFAHMLIALPAPCSRCACTKASPSAHMQCATHPLRPGARSLACSCGLAGIRTW